MLHEHRRQWNILLNDHSLIKHLNIKSVLRFYYYDWTKLFLKMIIIIIVIVVYIQSKDEN